MMKCQFCGKDYIKNPYRYMDSLPEIFKKNLEYIPDCQCLEKNKIREMEELEKKRVQECMKNKMKKCRDISVMDEKFARSRFESADMKSDCMKLAKRYAAL